MIADIVCRLSISRDFLTLIPETAFMATVGMVWSRRGKCSTIFEFEDDLMRCDRMAPF